MRIALRLVLVNTPKRLFWGLLGVDKMPCTMELLLPSKYRTILPKAGTIKTSNSNIYILVSNQNCFVKVTPAITNHYY